MNSRVLVLILDQRAQRLYLNANLLYDVYRQMNYTRTKDTFDFCYAIYGISKLDWL